MRNTRQVRTVRARLVLLVLACVAPAVLGAVYRSRQAEKELLLQVERRVDRVSTTLAEEIEEYQSNARLALSLTEGSARFVQALANRDAQRAHRMVQRLAGAYRYRVILASDAQAALEMRTRLEQINQGFRARGLPEIRTGIGLHSGQVVAGNMGHVERMEYTVIGDPVNLASRLEGMTKELACDVIMSEDLYRQVEEHVVAEPLKRIKVKGRDQDVMVYRPMGLKS